MLELVCQVATHHLGVKYSTAQLDSGSLPSIIWWEMSPWCAGAGRGQRIPALKAPGQVRGGSSLGLGSLQSDSWNLPFTTSFSGSLFESYFASFLFPIRMGFWRQIKQSISEKHLLASNYRRRWNPKNISSITLKNIREMEEWTTEAMNRKR